ncbi:hypothetical protein LOTGIDRAFT_135720, partial [Lottia gigantea]
KVQRVIIDGLGRTKDDLIIQQVQPIFQADNFEEMVMLSQEVKIKLQRLQLFKHIEIYIDTSKGSKSSVPNGYEVKFNVKETRRFTGETKVTIGSNNPELLFGLKMPNVFGRGERVQVNYGQGVNHVRDFGLNFMKPMYANPDVLFGCGIHQYNGEYPWSGYRELDRALNFNITFPSILGIHTLKWEGVWRDLRSLSRVTSFAVREQSGHSVKSSLKHDFVRDTRDNKVLPTVGSWIRVSQEYAGLGGNVEFAKQDIEFQFNQSLLYDTVLQFSGAFGIMRSLNLKNEIRINDRFFLGGPLTLRGFNIKGVGPHSDGDALGADAYWLLAAHLYTPLPFRPGKGGFGDHFRTHFFANAGNLSNISLNNHIRENVMKLGEMFRWAYGCGIVLNFMSMFRFELNYVVPVRLQRGDSANPGLQFGIGVEFL